VNNWFSRFLCPTFIALAADSFTIVLRFKNLREVFDGYKHTIQLEYGRSAETVPIQPAEGNDLPDNTAVESYSVICRLIVNNVTAEDCGEIECRAYNSGGVDTTRAKLNVHSNHSFHCRDL
jgi:hypothetical protein